MRRIRRSARSEGECVQPRLRLLGHRGEDHGDVIARMPVARAGNHDSGTPDLAVIPRGFQRQGHLRPRGKRLGTSKFNAAFVEDDGVG